MAKWPSKKELDKILPQLEKAEGTLHLSKNATPLDVLRWELCQKIIKYMLKNDLKQKELAQILGVDEPQMSRILRHRIDKVSTDKLIQLVYQLDPKVKVKVS